MNDDDCDMCKKKHTYIEYRINVNVNKILDISESPTLINEMMENRKCKARLFVYIIQIHRHRHTHTHMHT